MSINFPLRADEVYDQGDGRRTLIADHSSEKLSLHRTQNSVLLYGWSRFSEIRMAIRLYTTVAIGAIPPDVEKISGEKGAMLYFPS